MFQVRSRSMSTLVQLICWVSYMSAILSFSPASSSSSFSIRQSNTLMPVNYHFSNQQVVPKPLYTSMNAKKQAKSSNKSRASRNKIGNRTASTSGFGGAAVETCPCGASNIGYMKCCGKIHKSANAYASASAEQVVRARYSAYGKREVDFIIGSTHPLNSNFMADIEHWQETIKNNCYDNFELTSCKILSESYEGEGEKEIASVKFVATMIQVDSREKTAFMETSTFERAGKHIRQGAWLYKDGIVEAAPTENSDEDDEKD